MRKFLINFAWDLVGSFLVAVGIVCFADGIHIAPGGVSGLALLSRHLWGVPIGLTSLCINLPLLAAAWRIFGITFLRRTIQTLVITTIMFDGVVSKWLPQYSGDRILGAIVAGLLAGAGLAIIFLHDSTTAGTDILSRLVARRFPHIPIGLALLFIDGLVLIVSIPVYQNWESALLGAVALYCQTKTIDGIIYGVERGNTVLIITDYGEEVSTHILQEMERGATIMDVRGAYQGQHKTGVLAVVRPSEFHRLKAIIYNCDKNAFVVVMEARQIYGEGFLKPDR